MRGRRAGKMVVQNRRGILAAADHGRLVLVGETVGFTRSRLAGMPQRCPSVMPLLLERPSAA